MADSRERQIAELRMRLVALQHLVEEDRRYHHKGTVDLMAERDRYRDRLRQALELLRRMSLEARVSVPGVEEMLETEGSEAC